MRIPSVLFIGFACLIDVDAFATSLDMSNVTCKSFLETTNFRTRPVVVGWLIGRNQIKDARPFIDFDEADRYRAELLKYCAANPSISVGTAGERLR
jgi:hypothetical protein